MTTTITPFDNYEISGCKAFDEDNGSKYFEPVDDNEADCWTLYGHTQGEGVTAIGDFSTRAAAEEIYTKIVGEPFTGSYEAHPALRLRNAAPALLIAALLVIDRWNHGDLAEAVRKLAHVVSKATDRSAP